MAERLEQPAPQHVAAGLAQGQQPHLGKGAGGPATAGAAEGALVGRGIGHVQDKAVQRHGPHPTVKRPRRAGLAQQANDALGQHPQGCDSHPLACLAQGRASGYGTGAKGLQPAKQLAIAIPTTQPQCDEKPHHEPPRQTPTHRTVVTGLGQNFFHLNAGKEPLQGADSFVRRPRRQRVGLLAKVDHRSLLIGFEFWKTYPDRRLFV